MTTGQANVAFECDARSKSFQSIWNTLKYNEACVLKLHTNIRHKVENVINIWGATFLPISFQQNNTNTNCQYRKSSHNTVGKKLLLQCWWYRQRVSASPIFSPKLKMSMKSGIAIDRFLILNIWNESNILYFFPYTIWNFS